jgi:hypothetical protein
MRVTTVMIALGSLLAACSSSYETFRPPPLDFSNQAPLRLEVGAVTIQSAYRPQTTAPYVDTLLPLRPEEAIRQMLETRLVAIGGPGTMQAVILDASVKEEKLQTETGFGAYFKTQAVARLEGRLQVQVDRLDPSGTVMRSVSTAVSRTSSIPENVGYAERQRIGYQLVRDLVDDLDSGLTTNMQANFRDIIAP